MNINRAEAKLFLNLIYSNDAMLKEKYDGYKTMKSAKNLILKLNKFLEEK